VNAGTKSMAMWLAGTKSAGIPKAPCREAGRGSLPVNGKEPVMDFLFSCEGRDRDNCRAHYAACEARGEYRILVYRHFRLQDPQGTSSTDRQRRTVSLTKNR
jgi:hypothetical protein